MALSPDEKLILIAVLAAAMLFVIYFEMRIMRGRTREIRHAAQRKDEAFNAILTTRSVINVMERQGADTGTAQNLVKTAKVAMESGQFDRCMDLCEKARNELVMPSRSRAALAEGVEDDAVEKERFERVAERILASSGGAGESDSYKGTKLSVDQDGNYLSAKFEMNTAKADIKMALGQGTDTSEAQTFLTDAEGAFVAGNYTKAMSLAIKARRAISSEVERETIPLKAGEEPVEPEIERTAEEAAVPPGPSCRGCGAPLDPDDMFCHKCGTKVEVVRFCKSCGQEARRSDMFCRKCGAKVD